MSHPFLRALVLSLLLWTVVRTVADDVPSRTEVAKLGKASTALVEVKLGAKAGYGSAFCVHPEGLFVTNAHVVTPGGRGGLISLVLNSGDKGQTVLPAKLIRIDKDLDLALLRVNVEKNLPALPLGTDDKLTELAEIVACGFPFGAALTTDVREYPAVSINAGSITALRRKDGKLHRIQVDAALNPGNSGGPMLDRSGKVVGVVVAGVKGSGVNFAIPVSHVSGFLARPEFDVILPKITRSNLHKPAIFQAQCWSVPPPAKPLDFELVLAIDKGPERKLALERGNRMNRVSVVPLTMPAGPLPLRAVLEFGDRTVTGTLRDRTVKVNGKDMLLSDLRRISRQPRPMIILGDGRSLEGTVGGLEEVEIQVGKEQQKVDVTKTASALFELDTPATAISWAIIARQDGKEVGRSNGVLPLDDDSETRLVGSWEGPTSVGKLREVWTIAKEKGAWSVQGKYYDGDKELGACHGTEVKFSGGVLSFVHQYDKPPVLTWTSGAEVAMKLNGDQLEYTWKNGQLTGKVFLNRAKE